MAKQDDFVRITLRLPAQLHEALIEASSARSLNAEIVSRLEQSFEPSPSLLSHPEIKSLVKEILDQSYSMVTTYKIEEYLRDRGIDPPKDHKGRRFRNKDDEPSS